MKQLFPKNSKRDRQHLDRRWHLMCDLTYDCGGSTWRKGYRTRIGAVVAAYFHHYIASWGGSIELLDTKENDI